MLVYRLLSILFSITYTVGIPLRKGSTTSYYKMKADSVHSCSIIVVTSPSPLNPDTQMIKDVIVSAQRLFVNLSSHKPTIKIICDGYKVFNSTKNFHNPWAECKSGRVSREASVLYEEFCDNLEKEYQDDENVLIDRLTEHNGFAFCVKRGLLSLRTTYCLILQHGTNRF